MVLEIDYGELEDTCTSLKKAAKYCGDYSEKLQSQVSNKLGSLTMGSSNYTSSASYFTSAKIKSLNNQEQKFLDLYGKVDEFRKDAQNTDQRVASMLKKEGNDFRKANGLSFGWADGLAQVITRFAIGVSNSNAILRWISSQFRDFHGLLNAGYLVTKHWYACEGGKYVIEALVQFVFLVGAILTAFTALMIILPLLLSAVSVPLIFAACTAIAACISLADTMTAFTSSVEAALIAKDNPGWAARNADITSLTELLRKTHFNSAFDKYSMSLAGVIDGIDFICKIVSFLNMACNAKTFFTGTYRANAADWRKKFSMWDKNGDFSLDVTIKNMEKNLSGLKHAFTHDYDYAQWVGARKRNYDLFNKVEKIKNNEFYKSVMSVFKGSKKVDKFYKKFAY